MHLVSFLHDLAFIMIVAGIVTILFHRLKQPVVLGYIIAGMILGPHTPPFSFITDETTVKTLAELGVLFLMFSLGLEFSLQKLFRVGAAALVAALAEIVLMILVGYEIGQAFGWRVIDSIFLGAMLAISSTTIIVKALDEIGIKKEKFAQTTFGILVIEDILAIGILALLSGIAVTGTINSFGILLTLSKLLVFLVSSLIIGILLVPKLLSYVASFHRKEMLLITVLAVCFGFSLLVIQLGYSVALGAFLIGAIMGESTELKIIEKLITPITNMFSAIFFVSIGLLVDPKIIVTYIVPILIISLAVIIGKVVVCSLGVFVTGRDGKTSLQVGMSLAQIGEFSFIIASLGVTLKVTSYFLYPIIVAVSAITTLLTPYLIRIAGPTSKRLAKIMPRRVAEVFNTYTVWFQEIHLENNKTKILTAIKKSLFHIFINLMLIIAIFAFGSYLSNYVAHNFYILTDKIRNTCIWGMALLVSLPFLIAIYRKLKGLSLIIAEITVKVDEKGNFNSHLRRAIAEIIPILGMLGVIFMLTALSASILPPRGLLILILIIVLLLTIFLWREFVKVHSQLQIALIDQFQKKPDDK